MRKHRLQDIVLGMLLMALVMGLAVPALAAVTTKTLNANYMGIKIVVDGVPITPTDVNGNLVEPFAVDGTTYLPVRAVGEALGKEVTWDGNTNTVYVGEVPPGAIKNWVGFAYPSTLGISGGFSWATANELPNTFKAIEETGATVNPRSGRSSLDVLVGGYNTESFGLDCYDDGKYSIPGEGEPEVRIEGLLNYLPSKFRNSDGQWENSPNAPYKIVIRGMLQDIISDPDDVNSIMELIEKASELYILRRDDATAHSAFEEFKTLFSVGDPFEVESEHIYQLNCVNVELKESDWPYYHTDLIIKNK